MEENELVKLKLIGFNEDSLNSFSAVLDLAGRALKKKWLIVDSEEADFFLLSAHASEAANRDTFLKGLSAERCLFCATQNPRQFENELLVDNKHVPSLSALATLFNKVSDDQKSAEKNQNTELSHHVSTAGNSTAENSEAFFDPQAGLLGHLLAAKQEQLIVSLNDQSQHEPLYIDTIKNIYHSKNTLEQLNAYLLASEKLSIKTVSKEEFDNIVTGQSLKHASLKSLIWYIVMKTSSGKIIKGHSTATNIVALKNWPDLKLFKCLDYAKVAMFMKNNAAPLETIAAHTQMPLTELNNFYNACYLLGLVEPRNQIEIKKKTISSEQLDLLNKIDARLK